MNLTVLHDAWRPDLLTLIHRAEARAIVRELREAGHAVTLAAFDEGRLSGLKARRPVLRLSDPTMFVAAEALSKAKIAYIGPGYEAMTRCSDKHAATRTAVQNGTICPETLLAADASRMPLPYVLKPRWGSDSLGMRVVRRGGIPERRMNDEYIVQREIRGTELTVAVLHGRAGDPLQICLPAGVPYSFTRKYLRRPRKVPVTDAKLAQRVRSEALRIAALLHVDWAARIDFIHEAATDRLYFLECDVVPLAARGSAFEMSLTAARIPRAAQLELLLQGAG